MQELIVERLSPTAKLPTRAYAGDAGLDLYANEDLIVAPGLRALIKTGIKMAIPVGFAGLVWDKGGIANQGIHTMAGVIDVGYRGEVLICLINLSSEDYLVKLGQKIAQLLIQPVALLDAREGEVGDSERGDKKLGSSGLA